jgi:F420-dependent oxidoreductase-like protein
LTSAIKVGLHYETYDPIAKQRQVWKAADEAGFDQIWNSDHLAKTPSSGDPTGPILDAWTALAAQAADTKRIRIGVLVTGNIHRHPSLLAKMATTVDHISGGRLEVGLGTGWNQDALGRLGMPVPDVPARARMLDEACRVLIALWTQERATYKGRFYEIKDAIAEPKPVQKPHPPIVIGGRGAKVVTRVAARYAQGWNTSGSRGYDTDAEAVKALDEHCRALGRDPKTLRRSVNLGWNKDQGLRLAERYRAIGFTEFVIAIGNDGRDALEEIELLEREAVPALRKLA